MYETDAGDILLECASLAIADEWYEALRGQGCLLTTFHRYEITHMLGEGASAKVFFAHERASPATGHAVKVARTPEGKALLLREAHFLVSLASSRSVVHMTELQGLLVKSEPCLALMLEPFEGTLSDP